MDPLTLRRLSDIRHQEMLDSVLGDRTGLAKGKRHMDPLITGAALAHIYVNELNENMLDGDHWEPRPSWLQRFGNAVLTRLGVGRTSSTETTHTVQTDITNPSVTCMGIEG